MGELFDILYENYDTFEHHKVNEYMSSVALSVDPKYRGHGIGDQFLTSK